MDNIRLNLAKLILIILLLSGCGLFSTRTPEEPEGGSNIEWQFPRTPRIVVENLEVAVGRRSSVDYMRSFSTEDVGSAEFVFEADPDAEANNPDVFEDWDIERERNHVQSLFSPSNLPLDSLAELLIEITREPVILGDSADLSAEYELAVGHLRDAAPRRMDGYLDFSLKRADDGGWYIRFWRDKRIAGHHCWSDLKAQF